MVLAGWPTAGRQNDEILETTATIAGQYIDAVSTFEYLKDCREVLQADAVQELLDRHLPAGLMPNRPVALVDIAQAAIKNRAKHKTNLMTDFSLKIVPSLRPIT